MRIVQKFLSTPSARRATLAACAALHADAISIHALREEGDTVPSSETTSVEDFYPRPPRGGRLQPVFQGENCCLNFYPRPPRGGRRSACRRKLRCCPISIHALREEGDCRHARDHAVQLNFYPRPPRGGRPSRPRSQPTWAAFLSTPSARRATGVHFYKDDYQFISIHALREEGDP